MIEFVIKRNGSTVKYDRNKLYNAISKAGYVPDDIKNEIINYIENTSDKTVSVEYLQNRVEYGLMCSDFKNVAKEYIRYRYKREIIRKGEKTTSSVLDIIKSKSSYINTENSNKNSTILSTQRDYIAGEISKDLSDRLLIPEDIVDADRKGIIHFHDKDYFIQNMHNCCLVNLEDMLQNGTVISGTMIERPHSFATACNITTQIIAQVASNQYGGQSITLTHLAPFVDVSRKRIREEVIKEHEYAGISLNEDAINSIVNSRLKEEIRRGVQMIQYQVITLMTTNGQTPFITIFMYLNEAKNEREKEDLAMIIEEVIKQRYQGVKNEKGVWITPAFPKLIYALEEDNITEDSKYWYLTKLCAKCTAKRMVPDYVSEKKMLEYKYPISSLLTIKERRDNWGDERLWGINPFKDMTDEECEILQEYVLDILSGGGC